MLYRRPSVLVVFFALSLAAPAVALDLDVSVSAAASCEGGLAPARSSTPVHFDPSSGTLAVNADQSELGSLLRTVAEQAGIGVAVGSGAAGKVTVTFSGLPLEEGIKRIVASSGARNLAVEYTRTPGESGPAAYRLEKISVLGSDSAAQTFQQEASRPTGSTSTGSGGESHDKTQRERRNLTAGPKTMSPEARFGPERSGAGLGMPVQQVYHSPDDKGSLQPEGSGEEQQLHSLMRAAQQGDVTAIGLLGQMRHKPAAPLLARIVARTPEGSPERTAAAAALQQLAVVRRTP